MPNPLTIIKKRKSTHLIALTQIQVLFLRLSAHNHSLDEICTFLEIDTKKMYRIKTILELKFNSKNWLTIILKAIDYGFLVKKDYVNIIVKQVAIQYCDNLYTKIPTLSTDELTEELLKFNKECELKIHENIKTIQKDKTTEEENILINLKYKGYGKTTIAKKMELSHIKIKEMTDSIYYKLNTNNWFTSIRSALLLNIISKSINKTLNYKQAIKTISKLKALDINLELNVFKVNVYNELIDFYVAIEYYYLLKKGKK